jgi:hypothetical protein
MRPLLPALLYVEQLAAPRAGTQLERLARDALLRLRSQLCAVLAVATTPGIDGTEVEVLARPILEAGITFGWIGASEERAREVEAHAHEQAVSTMNEFVDAINSTPLVRRPERGKLPILRTRAKVAGHWRPPTAALTRG